MGLGKILRLGGIDNAAPKTDQSVGRFRVARNVMPTPDGTIIPRYDFTLSNTQAPSVREYMHLTEYNGNSLELISQNPSSSAIGFMHLYRSGVRVPHWINSPEIDNTTPFRSQLPVSTRVNNTTYIHTPYTQVKLMKYDGVEFGPAGCPLRPIATNSTATGKFVRIVFHALDFDNNEPVSEFIQLPAPSSGAMQFWVNNQVPAGYYSLPEGNYSFVNAPKKKYFPTFSGENSFEGTATYNSGSRQFAISASSTTITNSTRVGSYVFVAGNRVEMATLGFLLNNTDTGLALKVKSVSPLILDANDAYIRTSEKQWVKRNLTNAEGTAVAAGITYGCKYYATFWESSSSTGIYVYRGISPVYTGTLTSGPSYTLIITTGAPVAATGSDTTMFNIGASLNGWYDVTSKKLDVNTDYPFGSSTSDVFFSMSKFQNQLLMANQDVIWFSDSTLGGWIEQFNDANSVIIGDREFGRITAVCGTSDFLFVSRERKNYYVAGNLVTGNYRVQEVSEVDVGAWCNNSAIKIKDSVMFITSTGIYQMVEGGRCVPISVRTPKNFDNFSANNANEDVVFRLVGTNSALVSTNSYNDFGLSVAYDAYRDLLVWMRRTTGNPSIVVHTKSGELYEWDGIAWGSINNDANCLAFIQGIYYFGTVDKATSPTSALAFLGNENKAVAKGYCSQYPAKLYTSWITAGEPSLEKELLQLKIFGRIDSRSNAALKVKHYKDWNILTAITDTTYISTVNADINNQIQYSHKKRLNSDKCLSASVGIETVPSMDFEIESFEVEFNTIQAGMKR